MFDNIIMFKSDVWWEGTSTRGVTLSKGRIVKINETIVVEKLKIKATKHSERLQRRVLVTGITTR